MTTKKEIWLRNEIYTVYKSEQQERMKVYLKLNQEYEQCMSKCPKQYGGQEISDEGNEIVECNQQCERIYDQYSDLLVDRYQGDDQQKIDVVVKNSPIFTSRIRQDRNTWKYWILGRD